MNFLKATIDNFEGDKAVLKFADGQTLLVPIDKLIGFSEGDEVFINFYNDIESKEQRQKILKGILNEIIDQDAEEDNQEEG